MTRCPEDCMEKKVLHVTPQENIPLILKDGFRLPQDVHPERRSPRRGMFENDVLFFELKNELGALNAIGWKQQLETERSKEEHGILAADVCICNWLDEEKLDRYTAKGLLRAERIAEKAADFVVSEHKRTSYKEEYYDIRHFKDRYIRPKHDFSYLPFDLLSTIAGDATHATETKYYEYGLGKIMEVLGYDTSDGYPGAHRTSQIYEQQFMNEIIVNDVEKIYNIRKTSIKELCKEYRDDLPVLCEVCTKQGFPKDG